MNFTLRPVSEEHFPRMVEIINAQVREPVTLDDLLREERHRRRRRPPAR